MLGKKGAIGYISVSAYEFLMRKYFLLLPLLLLMGCGAQLRTMPVGAGHVQYNASLGGPLVKFGGNVVPIPYAMTGATYGITDRLEAHADLHVLAAMYKFLGLTPGMTYFPNVSVGNWIPSVTTDVLLFSDLTSTRAYPELLLTVAHPVGTRWIPYAGLQNTFQITHAPSYIPSVFAGTSLRAGPLNFYGELQWLSLNRNNHFTPVNYYGIGEHGALSPQFGVTLDMGGKK
jgi:hypothetical protein